MKRTIAAVSFAAIAPADKRTADTGTRASRTAESSPWANDWNFIAPAP
jgi:hypothetical protein